MNSLLRDYSSGILHDHEPPCLSLYQPTHRVHPDNRQDPIRFRNLLKALAQSLEENYPGTEARSLLRPFEELLEDGDFWNHTLDGLGVLAAPGLFRVYKLARPVRELAVVADSFHIKPLLRFIQLADRYHVLGLNRQEIKLFAGNRDALDEVELVPEIPRTVAALLGEKESREPRPLSVSPSSPGTGIYYGSGSSDQLQENETERFFRAVSEAILEQYSRPTHLPLILAALPENQTLFRRIDRNPYLIADEVTVHPDALSLDDLRERAWRAMEPHYQARLAGLVEMFGAARSKELGDDDLARVAASAVAARVGTLLTEADRSIPGRIHPRSGELSLGGPGVDDVLDDLAELVLRYGGQVIVVPKGQMPARTGIAAIYRF